jgi:hypothetical protein
LTEEAERGDNFFKDVKLKLDIEHNSSRLGLIGLKPSPHEALVWSIDVYESVGVFM